MDSENKKIEEHTSANGQNGKLNTQDEQSEEKEGAMSFLEHLEELRWHVVRSLIAIVAFTIVALLARDFIWGTLILGPSRGDFWTYRMFCKLGNLMNSDAFCMDELPFIIQSRQMTGQFTMYLTSSITIGLICAFPYTFWEIWRFISPGLYNNERQVSRGAVFFVSLLFMLGVLFGYFVIAPVSVNFLGSFQVDPSIQNEFDITSYVGTITTLVLAAGLLFQLPVVVFFLTKVGLLSPGFLRTYRRHAIVVILVLAALITPPDVMSQMLITAPLLVLYEVSISISAMVIRREKKAMEKFDKGEE